MFTFDASAIIHAWDNYPIEHFPPLWNWLSEQIADDQFSIPLVAEEGRQFRLPKIKAKCKIPAVCDLPNIGVECINFIELIKNSEAIFH